MKLQIFAFFLCCLRSGFGIVCIDDGVIYKTNGVYEIINRLFNGYCRKSYVSADIKADKVYLIFTNITIDCNKAHLKIYNEDQSNQADYCNSIGQDGSLLFIGKGSDLITINKLGNIRTTLRIQFFNLTDDDSEISTPPPLTQVTDFFTPVQSTNSPDPLINCGIPAIEPDETGLKVIGGKPSKPKSWPWQVHLNDGGIICGGSLINNQWIVTAGHCGFYVNTLFAYLGEYDLRNMTDDIMSVKVEKLIIHPGYGNPYNRFRGDWDIALVKLKVPILFSDFISPVCLPEGKTPLSGQTGITIGWGKTSYNNSSISPLLMQTSITIMPKSVCLRGDILTSRQICAGNLSPVKSSCQGDSGGPFMLKDDKTGAFWLTGVVSSGYDKCGGRTIYTNVSEFEDWIKETIAIN